jgi:hypothetical protein
VLEDPLLFGGSPAFLMTCPRTAALEETGLLTVLKIPFRVRTPKSLAAFLAVRRDALYGESRPFAA